MIHIVAFTGPLADPGDNGHAAVFLGNVVDQFLHQHGFANAGTAEQTDLTAAGIRAKQVDDLDAGFQNFRRRQLFLKGGCGAVNRQFFIWFRQFAQTVDLIAQDVEHPAQHLLAYRHADRRFGIEAVHAPNQTIGGSHRDAAHDVVANMLSHLDSDALAFAFLHHDRIVQGRQLTGGITDIHDRSDDLYDFSNIFSHKFSFRYEASAPATISVISCVIAA